MFRYLLLVTCAALLLLGCSDKQEEVKQLEREAARDEAADVMDSLNATAPDTGARDADTGGMEDDTAMETDTAAIKKSRDYDTPDYSQLDGYVVQLGSYATRDFAEMMAEKYVGRDFPAFVTSAEIDGQTYYRLRVGVYETFDDAKQVGEILKDRYSTEYWVDLNR